MNKSSRRAKSAPSPVERWTKARATVFLRLTLVIATSYLLLAQGKAPFSLPTALLVMAALASNLPFIWLPPRLVESTKFSAFLVVGDTLWITAALVYSGHMEVDFYVVYFFVLFLAGVSESLTVMTVATGLVSAGYLYSVLAAKGAPTAWSSPTLVRLPFFFAVAALYGYLTDRLRRERQAAQYLKTVARRDPLTELPNRRGLEERLERAIARALRSGQRMALLLFDLDEFKFVNDTYGHAVGDEVLKEIANRLQSNLRRLDDLGRLQEEELDVASRLGGDEFAVVLTEVEEVDGVAVAAQRLCRLISEPIQVENLEVATTVSVGITVFGSELASAMPPPDGHWLGIIRQRLLAQADRALYHAKQGGRNTFKFHDEAMDREIRTRVTLSRELKGILERRELFLEYQPQIDLAENSIAGAEALLRWRHPNRGVVPPAHFIPVAESSGQIREIGEWILETACREARKWMESCPDIIPVSVNLSAHQFRDAQLPELVAGALERAGLPPHLLELELTESVLLHETPEVERSLRRLHDEVGVRISLDDFGRGFSSLEYLRRFPIDNLKVDRFFVASVDDDPDSGAIVSAIIALAKELRLAVIAEGVETEKQIDFLRQQACDRAQGYYFSKPVSAKSFGRLLTRKGWQSLPVSPQGDAEGG